MGLDMYLEKMPRYKDTTINQVNAIQHYFDWKDKKNNPSSDAKKYTLKEWCGVDYKSLPRKEVIYFYEQYYTTRYWYWDIEHKYGHKMITEEVGYWRKANQIHNWFVENIQDGEDDCEYHREVTQEDLEELLDTCRTVLANSKLINGKVYNGESYTCEDGWKINYIEGKTIVDSSTAERLLPSASGFFFGGTDYDEYYLEDIKNTIDIITKVLTETDFEKEAIYYVSSW